MSTRTDPFEAPDRSLKAVNLGLWANVLLAALKTIVGVAGHSPALLADGINSTSDVAYYIVVRVFMRLAQKPADQEHPFGHRQMESISALIVGAFVMTTAIAIFWDAINKIYDLWASNVPEEGAASIALVVALFTVILKLALSWITGRIGRETHNPAVLALAYDHRNDVIAAGAASIGIFVGRMGHAWVDPLAGALVALVILRTGIEILRNSSDDLMDTVPGQVLEENVRQILGTMPQVLQVEEIMAHRFGPYLVLNITIGVPGLLTVEEGDRVADQVEQVLYQHIAMLRRVYVHYHPAKNARATT